MIRINLIGGAKKSARRGKAGFSIALPANVLTVLWVAFLAAAAVGGWIGRSLLIAESVDLSSRIAAATAERDRLQREIDENLIFESRRDLLRNRVDTIRNLQKYQASPVLVLDQLSLAMDRIDYIWLSALIQSDADVSIAGTVTSQSAFADFIQTLRTNGYFRNIDFGNLQEANEYFTFNLTCQFVPPLPGSDSAGAGGGAQNDGGGIEAGARGNPGQLQ